MEIVAVELESFVKLNVINNFAEKTVSNKFFVTVSFVCDCIISLSKEM